MAFCSAALLGPGGSALGLTGFPFGMQSEGPTLSTPSSAGGTVVAVAAEATGWGGCCCSTAGVTKPWLRIRALKRQESMEAKKEKEKKPPHFKFWHFPCHLALPDRSFGHLPILHPTCGGCERGSRGDRWWQRRCGGGGSRHGDDRSCGGRAERPDSDLLRLGGIFATMGTEKHASAICSAAPTAQHRHTPPVETVSYALVWAALKKCALKEEHKAEE